MHPKSTHRLQFHPSPPLSGSVAIPGDKSITHRAVIFGSMAGGTTTVHGYLPSGDCQSTIGAFRRLGVESSTRSGTLTIRSAGWHAFVGPDQVLDCGNSGTTARLLMGLLAGLPFRSSLTGDESLRRRPMRRVAEPLQRMGAEIRMNKGDNLPAVVDGRPLKGIDYTSPVASAQIKTCLLLAGITARGTTSVTEPALSRDHTERMLPAFGVRVKQDGLKVSVDGGQTLTPAEITVPGDISSAAFLIVAATLVPGSDITLTGVGVNPTRTGVLQVLTRMGAHITRDNERLAGGEPVADLRIRHAALKGIEIEPEMVPATIDEFPILFAAAAMASGTTRVRGAEELRVKESDRIAAMARELARVGVTVEEFPDGLAVHGPAAIKGAVCEAYGDHRLAMSMAILGLVADAPITVDASAIGTSFPDFSTLLATLGARVEQVD
ncbi:MAG: 3-phosphoshikimate 1-carboxyvinyltransferase [Nitrospirota bacterium]|nr:3-phosphoshikimate 1-carboxyvinyltransferase [Nitrospirota bacterium]